MKPKKTRAQILSDLRKRPIMPLWPAYGDIYEVCKSVAYTEAHEGLANGDPEFLRVGKLIKLVTAFTLKKLGENAV